MVESRCSLQREAVYRWFSMLSSAQRAEFLCGLLDLCVPVELRFLGSCLEDLARKDYHSLRDAEIKANNPADLANLTNITDEVVRSKLLISLALLGSDNRVAAAVLFRTLNHIDTIIHNYGLQLNDGQTGEQFLLLFTMASNHPAFSFHQKQVLRQQLNQIQEVLQVTGPSEPACGGGTGSLPALTVATGSGTYINAAAHLTCRGGCSCCTKVQQREVTTAQAEESLRLEVVAPALPPSCQELPVKVHAGKPGKVRVERIELKDVIQKSDSPTEYLLEVLWSNSTLSKVYKTRQEVVELISQLSHLFPDDCLQKFLPQSGHDAAHELDPRNLSSLPHHVLQHDRVRLFFSASSSSPQLSAGTSLSCLPQYRGGNRMVCSVASIQPVVNIHAQLAQVSSPAHLPPLPALALHPTSAVPVGDATQNHPINPVPHPHPQTQPTTPHCQPQPQPHPHPQLHPQPPPGPEQNGILDWLRKLRLHKYYPVFKQLTMEEFLALTEEDLNKYDLTQGAKKKLKTQLELQKEKLEKRYTLSQFPVSCGGVARVTPSSYNGPLTHSHATSSNSELRVEVEPSSLLVLRDSSSSSGYSSAPSSPMAPLSRNASFERTRETLRRPDPSPDPGEKDRPCFPPSPNVSVGGARPTAQVLPVQNEPSLSPSHPSGAPPSPLPLPLMSQGRGLGSPRKPRPLALCPAEERPKLAGSCGSIRLDALFPGAMGSDGVAAVPQEAPGARGPFTMLRSPPGLMVETSTALTVTSNTLHSVSHPPLQVCPSPAHARAPQYPHIPGPSSTSSSSGQISKLTFPSVSASASVAPMATVSGNGYNSNNNGTNSNNGGVTSAVSIAPATAIPMAAVSGNAYTITNNNNNNSGALAAVPPTSSPVIPETSAVYGVAQTNGTCVCSSCGCCGNCGSYGTPYAGYLPHPFSGTSVFTLGPLLHFSPLLTGSSSASPFSYPLVAPPLYGGGAGGDSQHNLVLPPVQGFLGVGGGANIYQPQGVMGNGGSAQKKVGNVSCYNCGMSGHRAQDCKHPPMDSAQQGLFRLKYSPQADSQDSGD